MHALESDGSCSPGLISFSEGLGRTGVCCMEGRNIKEELLTIVSLRP